MMQFRVRAICKNPIEFLNKTLNGKNGLWAASKSAGAKCDFLTKEHIIRFIVDMSLYSLEKSIGKESIFSNIISKNFENIGKLEDRALDALFQYVLSLLNEDDKNKFIKGIVDVVLNSCAEIMVQSMIESMRKWCQEKDLGFDGVEYSIIEKYSMVDNRGVSCFLTVNVTNINFNFLRENLAKKSMIEVEKARIELEKELVQDKEEIQKILDDSENRVENSNNKAEKILNKFTNLMVKIGARSTIGAKKFKNKISNFFMKEGADVLNMTSEIVNSIVGETASDDQMLEMLVKALTSYGGFLNTFLYKEYSIVPEELFVIVKCENIK